MGSWYSVEQVAQRLSDVLGEEVTPAAVYLGVHRAGHRPNARARPTAGMPSPANPGGRGLRFPADKVDAWLADHPRHARERLIDRLREEMAASEGRRRRAVAQGRSAGLSWQQLADLIGAVDGVPISRQAVAKKYE